MSGSDFCNCPEMVICDVIRMWSQVNDSLPGIGVTTPMLADVYVDKNPDWIGPRFSLFFEPFQLCHPRDDWHNHCNLSFLYVPDKFHLFPHGMHCH